MRLAVTVAERAIPAMGGDAGQQPTIVETRFGFKSVAEAMRATGVIGALLQECDRDPTIMPDDDKAAAADLTQKIKICHIFCPPQGPDANDFESIFLSNCESTLLRSAATWITDPERAEQRHREFMKDTDTSMLAFEASIALMHGVVAAEERALEVGGERLMSSGRTVLPVLGMTEMIFDSSDPVTAVRGVDDPERKGAIAARVFVDAGRSRF